MKKILYVLTVVLTLITFLTSCKKEPGVGGNCIITGKVFAKNYNSTFTVLKEEYYIANQYVYIIYGDDKDYSDKIRTSYDGTYEFKYLRPGTYHVYSFSKDSTLQTQNPIGIIKDVEIKKRNETVELPDIVIFN